MHLPLIVTMPRSGTWYIRHVLRRYGVDAPIVHGVPGDTPGSFWHGGQNYGAPAVEVALANGGPIVNVVREEAFDQMLSYYRHCINHKDQSHMVGAGGKRMDSFAEFVKQAAGLAYWRHFNAYRGKSGVYRLTYQKLTDEPVEAFMGVLEHMGILMDKKRLAGAIACCTRDKLGKLEREAKNSLANDQRGGSYHIKNRPGNPWLVPETGETIDPEMVAVCELYKEKMSID